MDSNEDLTKNVLDTLFETQPAAPATERLSAPPAPSAPRQFERRKLSGALAAAAKRSLAVDPQEVDRYVPTEGDVQIAEAMLAGALTFKDIAKEVGVSSTAISARMKDPITMAWLSRAVHGNIQHRLGLVDVSMLNQALAGNVRAAKLLYDRYHQMVDRKQVLHATIDFTQFRDEDLEALYESEMKNERRVIDIQAAQADSPPEASGGAPSPEGSSPPEVPEPARGPDEELPGADDAPRRDNDRPEPLGEDSL